MRFSDAVVATHPAIVTGVFVTLFIGGALAGQTSAPGIFAISMSAILGPLILWHFSLYRASSLRTSRFVGHQGRRGVLFVTTILSLAAFLLTGLQWLMIIGCLSWFAAIWAAANALTRYNEQKRDVELHKTLVTFLLEFYLPIGIWVIYPRIKKMLSAPVEEPT